MTATPLAYRAIEPLISIRNLDHYFGADALRRQVLFDITIEIAPGEIVILTGPSGSGKTTLLTLCGALRTVQEGSVCILGTELRGASKSTMGTIRESVGVIFQAHHLLDALTAIQNVALALGLENGLSRAERYGRAAAALEAVGLADRLHYYPSQMSGGQKQRVAVARALVRRPKIVLADEPTASLDRHTGREVIEILHELARGQGCAVLLVTHDNRILDIADRIVTLEDGRLISFAGEMAANADNMLKVFARLQGSGELTRHLKSLSTGRFLAMIEHMTAEFQHYLRVFQVGSEEAVTRLFDTVLEAVALKIFEVMQAERGTLYLVNRDAGILRSHVARGDGEQALVIEVPIDRSVAGQVLIAGGPVNVTDAYNNEHFNSSFDCQSGFRTRNMLCMPVFDRNNNIFAVAQLINKVGAEHFSKQDEDQFKTFAEPVSVILAACLELRARVARGGSE